MTSQRTTTRGFTIIELLVVVTIIVLLLALLSPTANRAIELARATTCEGQQRLLTMAWIQFSMDNGGKLCGSDTGFTTNDWVSNPGGAWPEPASVMQNGSLWQYVKNLDTYRCPNEPLWYHTRSYSINCYLNSSSDWYGPSFPAVRSISLIQKPAKIFCFIDEEDPRGYNINSFMVSVGGSTYWTDVLGSFHGDAAASSYADGHSIIRPNLDPNTKLFAALNTQFPNSPDLAYYQGAAHPSNP